MGVTLAVADVKRHLIGLDQWFRAAERATPSYTEDDMAKDFPAWIRSFQRECEMRWDPVQVQNRYSSGDLPLTPGLPIWTEDPYTYYTTQGQEFFVCTLRQRPVQTVQRARVLLSNTDTVFEIPSQWIRFEQKSGRFWVIPASGALTLLGTAAAFASVLITFGGKQYLPQALAFEYVAGLPTGWDTDPEWADFLVVLQQICALEVLKKIAQVMDAGRASKQVGAGGVSQSIQYTRFQDRKEELQAAIDRFKATAVPQESPLSLAVV